MSTVTDDDQKSVIDQRVEDGQGSYLNGAESAAAQANQDQAEAFENEFGGENFKKDGIPGDLSGGAREAEEKADPHALKYTGSGGQNLNQPKLQKALAFAKKRGGIIGLISLFGIGGGLLAGFFGPASMIINLTENVSLSNDSSSTAMERRLMKVFGNMTNKDGGDAVCANKKNIKCKMGKISNKALRQLSKKGVVAYTDGGKTKIPLKRTGYPSANPSHYEIDLGDGKPPKKIPANELMDTLVKHPKAASKVLGVRGAFNLRVKAWAGKHITKKFFDKFGIRKGGGLADGSPKKGTVREKIDDAKKKVKESIEKRSKGSSPESIAGKVKGKLEKHMNKSKKGGTAYVIAVGGCIAVKAPGYIAAGVAAVQLAQLMPIAMDVFMSPGSKAKASGVDTENSITSEDMDYIGMLLTHKTRNAAGKMTSALDSKYLLAAMGVNKGKPGVATNLAPGYSLLTSNFTKTAREAEKATKDACNAIMSPTAMYAAMAADMAVTIAASATIIGGLIKIAASWIISELVSKLVSEVAGDLAINAIKEFAKNDAIPNAEGEEFGHVLGLSAEAFFSAGGMARHLPGLTVSQLDEFADIQGENEAFQRDMDIASLSPFDISSRYTFLGSILHNAQMAVLANGGYGSSSILAALPSLPMSLVSNAGATLNFSANYCGYGSEFNLDTSDAGHMPAINSAGMPCTGMTRDQINMTTDEAMSLLIDEGWICDGTSFCPDIPEDASIEELMPKASENEDGFNGNGFIRPDNLLYETVASCSSAENGDYIFNAAGCTVKDSTDRATGDKCLPSNSKDEKDKEDNTNCADVKEDEEDAYNDNVPEGVKNPRSLMAINVFLLDYQIVQAVNGHDDVPARGAGGETGELVGDKAYPVPNQSVVASTYGGHTGLDMSPRPRIGNDIVPTKKIPVFAVAAGTVAKTSTNCPATFQHRGAPHAGVKCPGDNNGYGNRVEIVHDGDIRTVYAHLLSPEDVLVKEGDVVKAGQQIGVMGSTGNSSGFHLHFEVYISGTNQMDYGAFNWLKANNILPTQNTSL